MNYLVVEGKQDDQSFHPSQPMEETTICHERLNQEEED